jgi:hypothetical protein
VALVAAADAPAVLSIAVNDGPPLAVRIAPGTGWRTVAAPGLDLARGTNRLKVGVSSGSVRLKTIRLF